MRYWDNKEVPGRGTKYCLVIDPEDGTNPIRTYGWSEAEVLDKVAKTAETAQQVINRQRAPKPTVLTTETAHPLEPKQPKKLSAEERMQATVDLTNPARSAQAVKALLGDVGVDVDKMALDQDARRAAAVAQEWERSHPEVGEDERNHSQIFDKALMLANGKLSGITADTLETAYRMLLEQNRLFWPDPERQPETPPNAPGGSPAPRTVRPRGATSYRSSQLRGTAPGAQSKPKYTRAEIAAMTTKDFHEKVLSVPEVLDWYNREFSAATA